INQNVFSAQYEGPYGGGIEIFTRPNVTKFRTFVSFGFADGRLNASDPFLQRRVPYQSKSLYFNSTGPLFGKKTSFFVYGGLSGTDSSAVINAVILDADLRPAAFRQTFSTPGSSENVNFSINADPNKKHKLYFNYGFGRGRSKGQNVGGFLLPSRANENESQNHSFQFSETFFVDPDIVNQSRAFVYYGSNNSFGGSTDPAINVLDSYFGGGSQQNATNKNLRFDVSNETTWQMGRYALGFGVRFRGETIDQNSTANFGGTYTFSGRLAPALDANNQPIPDGRGGFLTEQIDSLESYRRTLFFSRAGYTDQQIRELGGGANQLTVSGGNPAIKLAQYDFGVYLQNSYKISDTIAASFGLRYENQTNIGSNYNFAPRFGLIWSPKAKDKQNPLYTLPRVSVGYGLFYSRFGLNNTLNVKLASDPDRAQYLIMDPTILDLFPAVPSSDLLQQFALPRTQRVIADGFESPYQSLLNFNVLKKLPKGFSLNFSFSHGKYLRQNYTQNINAPLGGSFDPLDPSAAVRPFGNVGNIYQTRSFGRTVNERVSVNLNFPQTQKLFASIRYSYAKTRSNVVSGSGSPFDPYDFSQDYGPSSYDGVHSGGGYFYYSLPFQKI
ncbi:MAG: hypothetical protein ABI539_07095, partial [Acidobacteriota bacterium]